MNDEWLGPIFVGLIVVGIFVAVSLMAISKDYYTSKRYEVCISKAINVKDCKD